MIRRWCVALIAAVLAVALASCSSNGPSLEGKSDGRLTKTAVLSGQKVRLDLPTTQPVAAVAIWVHGQGGDADTRMNQTWLNSLRQNGWAVASGEFHDNSWGDASSVQDFSRLEKWAAKSASAPVNLVIGGSMGAAISLNALERGAKAKCFYATMPVVDLRAVSNVPDATTQLKQAYPHGFAAWNPVLGLAHLPTNMRYRVLSSPGDTWVPAKRNAAVLAAALMSAGAEVSTKATRGQHGDPSNFSRSDLDTFADGCR